MHLLTDGKSIFLEEAPNRIIDLLKNARQPMFLVCVTDQVRRLNATARSNVNLRAAKPPRLPPQNAPRLGSGQGTLPHTPCVYCARPT